jgi:hypothetical protein
MTNSNNFLDKKVLLLKAARIRLLSIHKSLIDEERSIYEIRNGALTSGQLLNLLVNAAEFQWLRRFSALIVEIDEMFDLDDGYTEKMVDLYLSQISDLINMASPDDNFNKRYVYFLQGNHEIATKHKELRDLLLAL